MQKCLNHIHFTHRDIIKNTYHTPVIHLLYTYYTPIIHLLQSIPHIMIVRISSTSAIYDVQHRRRRREVLHLRILSVVEGDSESLWCYGKMRFCFFYNKDTLNEVLIYVVICFWYVFSWLKCGIQTHRIKAGLGSWHHAGTAERTLAMPDWATTNGITRPGYVIA